MHVLLLKQTLKPTTSIKTPTLSRGLRPPLRPNKLLDLHFLKMSDGRPHSVIVQYDGEWEKIDRQWEYEPKASRGILIKEGITFDEIVERLHTVVGKDKSKFELVIKVKYNLSSKHNIPAVILSNEDVDFFLQMNSLKPFEPIPLCISVIYKGHDLPSVVGETIESPLQIDVDHEVVQPLVEQIPPLVAEMANVVLDGGIAGSYIPESDPLQDPITPGEQSSNKKRSSLIGSNHKRLGTSSSSLFGRLSCFRGMENDESSGESDLELSDHLKQFEKFQSDSSMHNLVPFTCPFEIGALFQNKAHLRLNAAKYALSMHFETRVVKSNPDLCVIKCISKPSQKEGENIPPPCPWRVRAVKMKDSDIFEVRKYVHEHTCDILNSTEDTRQATSWVIGDLMKHKYQLDMSDHPPKKVMEDVQGLYGLRISYHKAWRSVESALVSIRGSIEESYEILPSFLYMLRLRNEGTVTDLKIDPTGHFRYSFMALGQSIRGYKSCIRPVLCVDACHLKHKLGGRMLIAIALDANEKLYPVAIGIADGENNESWDYFMKQLRIAIGLVPNQVFVSDRNKSIASALTTHFPEAHHGACMYHLKMNIMHTFKTDICHNEFEWAARAYKKSEFRFHFGVLQGKDPRIAKYLEDVGFERWSRAYFPGIRYNVLTSNYAESFNSKCKDARRLPVDLMLEWIRFSMGNWFQDRRTKALNWDHVISKKVFSKLKTSFDKAIHYSVWPMDAVSFVVQDGQGNVEVDLERKTCTCREFDLQGLPCKHALAAARKRKWQVNDLCSKYYRTEAWTLAYVEVIHPVGDKKDWEIPEVIKSQTCKKPIMKVKKGRVAKKRKRSRGEGPVQRKRCGSCGTLGHNRASCTYLMPAPTTERRRREGTSQPSTSSQIMS